MGHLKNDRGATDSKTPIVITVIVIFVVVVLGIKLVPVKIRAMKMENGLQEIMLSDLTNHTRGRNEKTIKAEILGIAKEIGLPPLDPKKNIQVKKHKNNNTYTASVNYFETISFPIFGKYKWAFEFSVSQ